MNDNNRPENPAQTELKRLVADKTKKAKISGMIAACSIAVVIVFILLNEVLGTSQVFAVFASVGFFVAIFSGAACVAYMKDIPKSERTKGQKIFFRVITVIGVLLVIFMIWYRFLGGMEFIIKAALNS